jgi:hypothetical protein
MAAGSVITLAVAADVFPAAQHSAVLLLLMLVRNVWDITG